MKLFSLVFFAFLGMSQLSFAQEEKEKKEAQEIVSGSSETAEVACDECCESESAE